MTHSTPHHDRGEAGPLVHLRGVTKKYRQRTVLTIGDIALYPGVTALVGANGAGKTTMMDIAATAITPTTGTVTIDGIDASTNRTIRDARRLIGYLPQGFTADRYFTVRDLVAYAAWLRGVATAENAAATKDALHTVDLWDRRHDRLGTLSGGMMQRVGIATAIVGSPRLIILDEPTVGLDPRQRAHFRSMLTGMTDVAILISTHLIDDVDALADRVILLEDGQVRFDDTLEALTRLAPAHHDARSDLEAAYLHATTQ